MELYHYTTLDNFLNISKSGQYWLSAYNSMNDSEEFKAGYEIIEQIILAPNVEEEIDSDLISKMQSAVLSIGRKNHFVFSTTTSRDNATMYGAYLGDNPGVCLKIKVTQDVCRIFYDKESFSELVRSELHMHYDNISSFRGNLLRQGLLHEFGKFCAGLCLRYKDAAFEQEMEYRVIFPFVTDKKVNFRSNSKRLVPYIVMDYFDIGVIEEVIIRSSPYDMDTNKDVIEQMIDIARDDCINESITEQDKRFQCLRDATVSISKCTLR